MFLPDHCAQHIKLYILTQLPFEDEELRKTLFKLKLHELLLKVLETEEVYVDIIVNAVTRINLMSLLS